MPYSQLISYIKQAREQKITDASIKSNLLGAGWNDTDISEGFAAVDGPVSPASSISPASPAPSISQPSPMHTMSEAKPATFTNPTIMPSSSVRPAMTEPSPVVAHPMSAIAPDITISQTENLASISPSRVSAINRAASYAEPLHSYRKTIIFLVVGVLILALCAGAAYAYVKKIGPFAGAPALITPTQPTTPEQVVTPAETQTPAQTSTQTTTPSTTNVPTPVEFSHDNQ